VKLMFGNSNLTKDASFENTLLRVPARTFSGSAQITGKLAPTETTPVEYRLNSKQKRVVRASRLRQPQRLPPDGTAAGTADSACELGYLGSQRETPPGKPAASLSVRQFPHVLLARRNDSDREK
jgi:hypothetical protein